MYCGKPRDVTSKRADERIAVEVGVGQAVAEAEQRMLRSGRA